MQATLFLAQFLGIAFCILGLALLVQRKKMLETMKDIIDSHASLFILELMSIAAGLAIVLNHNIWSGSAVTVVVTFIGWVFLARGIIAMFLSYLTMHTMLKAFSRSVTAYYLASVVIILLGLYLTYA